MGLLAEWCGQWGWEGAGFDCGVECSLGNHALFELRMGLGHRGCSTQGLFALSFVEFGLFHFGGLSEGDDGR